MFDVKRLNFDRRHKFYTLCLEICALLLYISKHVKGVVEIAPSEVAAVCQAGYQLEVICSTPSVLHTWQLIANPESGAVTPLRQVSSVGSPGVESEPIIINSTTMITFSRLSSSPLTSRMTINPVSEGLNGSRVNCVDGGTSDSATITILIIGDTPPAKPSIQSHSEQFSSDRIVVILEWTLSNSLGHYQQLLLPNVSINIVPDPEVEIMCFGNMSNKLMLHCQYNTLYNVSITQPGVCGQPNQTAFIELSYTKCYNPVRAANPIIEGYEDPALEGKIITVSCNDGLTLIGPNSSTCINGEWEPDPWKANCTGTQTVMTSMPTTSPMNPINSCGDPPSKCPESGSTSPLALSLGTVFGVILLAVTGVIVVILFVIIFKRKGIHKSRTRELEYADTDTSNGHENHVYSQLHRHNFKTDETQFLYYAEINSSSLKKQSPLLDDNRVEYAQLNHSIHRDKVSTSQVSQTVEKDNFPPVNLDNLLVQLQTQVSPKWYEFGAAAGIQNETLDKFAEECLPEECIVELFDYWLMNSVEKPTWRDVAKVLKKISLTELGLSIESVYTTGTLPIVVDMNFIPKLNSEEESELPPPLPPRESTPPPSLSEEPLAPALPPKPTKIRLV